VDFGLLSYCVLLLLLLSGDLTWGWDYSWVTQSFSNCQSVTAKAAGCQGRASLLGGGEVSNFKCHNVKFNCHEVEIFSPLKFFQYFSNCQSVTAKAAGFQGRASLWGEGDYSGVHFWGSSYR
jgi:hypothetical protein